MSARSRVSPLLPTTKFTFAPPTESDSYVRKYATTCPVVAGSPGNDRVDHTEENGEHVRSTNGNPERGLSTVLPQRRMAAQELSARWCSSLGYREDLKTKRTRPCRNDPELLVPREAHSGHHWSGRRQCGPHWDFGCDSQCGNAQALEPFALDIPNAYRLGGVQRICHRSRVSREYSRTEGCEANFSSKRGVRGQRAPPRCCGETCDL